MKSMKLSKAEAKAEAVPSEYKPPEYPYGLCIRLEKEQLAKLGLKSLPAVGDSFEIEAKATVKSVSMSQSENGDHGCIELQITDLGLDDDDAGGNEKRAKMLFGGMESKK